MSSKQVTVDFPTPAGLSRRAFGRIIALATAGAALPFYNEATLAAAQYSKIGAIPEDAVKINANENPLGPCNEAREAIYRVTKIGGRYQFEETEKFINAVAEDVGVKPDHVAAFAGSSDPLHRTVLAYTSRTRSFVIGDPGYESGPRAAELIGAKVVKVPLTKDHAHDVRAMLKNGHSAGLFYICNPNNPTGTLTPRADIEYLLANKPKGSILLLDEAYIHLTEAQSCTDLVAAGKDLIVLRTWSKIYGMAGLRAGCAIGRPDLLEKLKIYNSYGAMPVTGMVAATASLQVKTLVPERRKLTREAREDTFAFLQKHNFSFIPSDSNCFMLDAKRPGKELVEAMAKENVFIGRTWPIMPNYARITVGTREEMLRFQTALLKVWA